MNELKILSATSLFENISENEIQKILPCLKATKHHFRKGEYIYRLGDKIKSIGVVLSGSVDIIKYDLWGNTHIIERMNTGGSFAEAYACQKNIASLVDVVASEESQILLINTDKILQQCTSCCPFHRVLIENLLQIIAQKNLNLIKKIELLTPKSLRQRVIAYLTQVHPQEKNTFDIPFNRQQLADYLCVDRSALSAELSKMKNEGLIDYHKNHFILKK